MAAKFEKVSRFANQNFVMPHRATAESAGYDFVAAEDILIPAYLHLFDGIPQVSGPLSIEAAAEALKGYRPTLVSTGVKCRLDEGTYLKLVNRSSGSFKHLLIVANGEGIIDKDYYNNSSNEGEIFFQFLNLSPYDIIIHKGDKIGQGIICQYEITEDDVASGLRTGGFGSTGA